MEKRGERRQKGMVVQEVEIVGEKIGWKGMIEFAEMSLHSHVCRQSIF